MSPLLDLWPLLLAGVIPLLQGAAAVHVLMRKRDVRAAIGWMGLIWLVPLLGVLLYAFLGINRVQRKAQALRTGTSGYEEWLAEGAAGRDEVAARFGSEAGGLPGLVSLGDRVTERPLLRGNVVTPLVDGEEAYPAMLEAIDGAEKSISLLSYIFDDDAVGRRFVEALGRAVGRGVEVRVLVDDAGAQYSVPPVTRALKRKGVEVARFMPTVLHWRMPYFNLRNHRKILVVDGRIAFTGGMNIRAEFWKGEDPGHFARDLHFRIEGPVVSEIQEVFAVDWTFTTRERLEGPAWFPELEARGEVLARGISDGPDIDFEKLETVILGALHAASTSVRVITPYFLPDRLLVRGLTMAAQRGVDVEVLVPEKGNLPPVQWASTAQLDLVLEKGVRVYSSPPPFDHSKVMVVDGVWTLMGSANWDPRSLQLNFEFNVECYDRALGARMEALFAARRDEAREIGMEELRSRPFPIKLRDAATRLFSPYL